MEHIEVPVLARCVSSFENASARVNVASAYTQQCQSLATLCRVSPRFKDQLQPMLYACIVIQSRRRMDLLEETLQANPGIAYLVKTIVLMPWAWPFPSTAIQSLVSHCPSLEAFQDYTLYPHHDRAGENLDLPTGVRLKKISARIALVRHICNSPIRQSILASLELVGSEPTPLVPALTLPALESLKIAITDHTLYGCILPSLRCLYIESGYYNGYIDRETLASTLEFFQSCGKKVVVLSFGQLNLFGGEVSLETIFPSVKRLLIGTGRGPGWFLPAWSVPLFDISLGHPKIENIGLLYGTVDLLESSCLSTSDLDAWAGINYHHLTPAIIEHFASLNRECFPRLKMIHDMGCQTGLASLKPEQAALWDGIKQDWINNGIHVGVQDFAID